MSGAWGCSSTGRALVSKTSGCRFKSCRPRLMRKIQLIFLNAVPTLLMIGLIPFILNDYALLLLYVLIAAAAFWIKKERNDLLFFAFGFFAMVLSEYLFVSTGVETFVRNSLFGVMPVWLPVLWGYGFVAIKRASEILKS